MAHLRLAVLLSGSGTTLENLFEKCAGGKLDAEVVVVVSSRADAYGLERTRRRNVPALVVERRRYAGTDEFSAAIFAAIEPYAPDAICLAGFMSLLRIPEKYRDRILNVHPALLPAFGGKGLYGHHVHEAVLRAGCKVTGCTVHFVGEKYDSGPIVAQKAVPVMPDDTPDTLAARVQAAERELYPEAVQLLAEGRLSVKGQIVKILPE
ncbi:MAG: phosphoribosylglycinamide formyltransferase [Planctomycetota bacterium]|nr:phosphoribosylglycinamide formyltransferase [Planctomycetota bacterium]